MTLNEAATTCQAIEKAAKIVPGAQNINLVKRAQRLLIRAVYLSEGSTLSFPRWLKERSNQLTNELASN